MAVDLGLNTFLVLRDEWGARPPRTIKSFNPSFGSTIHWEGPTLNILTHLECSGVVRRIQNYHMDSKGWSDIAYTALVCPHGFAYEGRWIGVRTAANGTTLGNNTSYAICYLGGIDDSFTELAKKGIKVVQDFLQQHGKAGPGRNCHRDWKPTQCPGDRIYAWVEAGQPVDLLTPSSQPLEQDDDVKRLKFVRDPRDGSIYLTDLLSKIYIPGGTDTLDHLRAHVHALGGDSGVSNWDPIDLDVIPTTLVTPPTPSPEPIPET